MISPAVRVLGAVSWSGRRQLHCIEKDRIDAAKATARLLGCCGFLLPSQLSYLKQFALPKANYGWVARVPPGLSLNLSGLPFGSQLAVSGTPVRGCVLFSWGVACTWMSLGSLAWWLRSFVLASGLVTLPGLIMVGLVPALCVPGSVLTISRPSVLSGVILLLLSRSTFLFVLVPKCWSLLSVLLNTMFGKAGGFGFGKNIPNVAGMRSTPFLSLIKTFFLWMSKTLSWILCSPSAATVGLSAFSPGTCSRIPSSSCSSTCLCGCGNVGFWEHITWECLCRLGPFPPKPSCPLKLHALMRS